ncbi:hypothetical protein [Actibacterium sp. 188UL27-1]|uniref:hypothetical protein n=1 Tax=Actibacterium sp. 188UL27-1 TaxID=2786961 RepID=UPI00195D62C1|nr:hypothetical protein [Actibacterium sp. 188UL27-1]MBM7069896.1 hypothetical protein [Actibacterium sp. 188UL27-1]
MNSLAIETLLDQEEDALRHSDFSRLEQVLHAKETLLDALQDDSESLSREDAQRLKDAAERNNRLHQATIRGLRSVIDRLAATRRATSHLDTYTAQGQRRDLATPRGRLEKKA